MDSPLCAANGLLQNILVLLSQILSIQTCRLSIENSQKDFPDLSFTSDISLNILRKIYRSQERSLQRHLWRSPQDLLCIHTETFINTRRPTQGPVFSQMCNIVLNNTICLFFSVCILLQIYALCVRLQYHHRGSIPVHICKIWLSALWKQNCIQFISDLLTFSKENLKISVHVTRGEVSWSF